MTYETAGDLVRAAQRAWGAAQEATRYAESALRTARESEALAKATHDAVMAAIDQEREQLGKRHEEA